MTDPSASRPSTTPLRAIETAYAGCTFRSRLEARWAVFFDAAGIPWEYEPDGFPTSAGNYLPDFRIRIPQLKNYDDVAQWFEVKPDGARVDARHAALAAETHMPLITARGIPRSYADQLRDGRAGHSPRHGMRSPLLIHGVAPEPWPVAFCDSTAHWRDEHYCALGDNRHWCQEAMNKTLEDEYCHLALYGLHQFDGDTIAMFHPPIECIAIDRAYRLARSARFEHGDMTRPGPRWPAQVQREAAAVSAPHSAGGASSWWKGGTA